MHYRNVKRRGAVIQASRTRSQIGRGLVPFTLYDTALTELAYGQPGQLGDFFGDVMGAIVGKDNWDARPTWMKNMKVKPDPSRLLNTAAKVVPPRMVGGVLRQANQAGFDMFYNTPAGSIPVTPEFAEGVYGNYPTFLKTRDIFTSVPWWVYAVGAGGILFAFTMRKK